MRAKRSLHTAFEVKFSGIKEEGKWERRVVRARRADWGVVVEGKGDEGRDVGCGVSFDIWAGLGVDEREV